MWIEYNGLQHYKKVDYFHKTDEGFLKQLNRDNEVRKYCKENNIILIEIPYTYNTYEKVEQLLNRVILNGEDINSIIDYSKLYKKKKNQKQYFKSYFQELVLEIHVYL